MNRWLKQGLCGALMGAGAVLPGVSGGVLAVIFGIYQPLMEILSHPKTALPRYWPMLPPLGVGWCAGFLLFAKGICAALHLSEAATVWLFIGLIGGALPSLFREAGREGRDGTSWAALILCAAAVSGALFYMDHVLHYTARPSFLWYSFCGALWGASVVIPGLTSASILMALGLYQPMMESLSRLELSTLSACLPGMGVSVLLLARLMDWLLRRYRSAVFHGILGVVAASTAAIVPLRYESGGEAALSALFCAAGFALAFCMERLGSRP